MTRRVRFSPRLAAGVFAAALALARPPAAQAVDVPFVPQPPVATNVQGATRVAAADVDGDGDTDLVSTATTSNTLAWHENAAGNGSTWITRTISTALDGSYGVTTADVDGDGDVDVVAASHDASALFWYENTAGNGTAWTTRTISTGLTNAVPVAAADVDGDGDQDVVVAAFGASTVTWHENTAGNGTAWATHTVATSANGPVALVTADVDRDGDVDVVSASSLGSRVAWHENVAGNGSTWTTRTITTGAQAPFGVFAADVDGDGDIDVGSASYVDDKVAWYENTAGNGTAWTTRTITTDAQSAYAVAAADVDHDGDVDVISASLADGKVAWYENTAGNGSAFTTRTVTTAGNSPFGIVAADLDGEGDLDIAHASFSGSTIAWLRNETVHASACFVPRTAISTAADGAISVLGADVDGDGHADVVAASTNDDAVRWHENAAGNGTAWTPRTITTAADGAYTIAEADVDGDGDVDVLAGSYYSGVAWHDNAAGNGTAWTPRTVSTAGGTIGVAAADVDGDGDTDALSASFASGLVAWHSNTAGNGTAWTVVTIASGLSGAFSIAAGDVDGDGDVDAVSAAYGDDRVAWYENTAGNGSAWVAHTLATVLGAIGVSTADVDGDGDLDVLSASYGSASGTWHENASGNGSVWITHTISTQLNGVNGLAAADLDGDGDLDALSNLSGDDQIAWHENTSGNGTTWVQRTLAAGNITRWVAAADLDRDGDADALWVSQGDDQVAWHDNRSGSVAVAVTNTAPATANNGDVVSMLRLLVTHLGRPGDHDVEFASLGVLFEEEEGDPLTTAEANALIETFRVYRDANANSVFDPAIDVLVTSVPTLTLVNGIATIVLPDGDPNLQVAHNAPQEYFLVVELTATASGQAPNQFRLTHLGVGPLASLFEDRSFDIPLRVACPADVSSSIRQVIPVELIGFTIE